MIQNISIFNYQSHKSTSIDLHPGVNALLGPSRSGKSAVLRALRWLIENKTPPSFRSHWGGDTEVSLIVNGQAVARRRTKAINQYAIEASTFDKVGGGGPPDEVADLLNINSISLQWQHDSPFLLSENSGEVARTLNKTVGLEAIDRSTSKITSMERQANSELRTREKDLEEIEAKLIGFVDLDSLDALLSVAETFEAKIKKDDFDLSAIKKATADIGRLECELLPVRELSKVDLGKASELNRKLGELSGKCRTVQEWMDSIETFTDALAKAQAALKHGPAIERLDGLWAGLEQAREEWDGLESIIESIQLKEDELAEKEIELNELADKLENEAPETCPLCGRSCDCNE